jgi:hypothetical protein
MTGLQVIDGLGRIRKLKLGLGTLRVRVTDHFRHSLLCGFHRPIVEIDSQLRNASAKRVGDLSDSLGNLDRQLSNRLGLGDPLAGNILFPNLPEARHVAPTDLLPKREKVTLLPVASMASPAAMIASVVYSAGRMMESPRHNRQPIINKLTNKPTY